MLDGTTIRRATNARKKDELFRQMTVSDLHILSILMDGRKYGLEILKSLEDQGNPVALGSIYGYLRRLEKNNLVESEMGDNSGERGGHRRKYFKITEGGQLAWEEARLRLSPILQYSI